MLEAGTRDSDPVRYRYPDAYGTMALSRAEFSDYAWRQGDQWTNKSVLEAGTRDSDPGRYRHPDVYGTMALSRAVFT